MAAYSFTSIKTRYAFTIANGAAALLLLLCTGAILVWLKDIRHNKAWAGTAHKEGAYIVATLQEPLVEKTNAYKAIARFTAIVKTTIVERNLSMTVTGKHFKNVIHTRLDLKYDMLGFIMEAGTYDYFIAKGVGIIKVRTQLLNFGVPVLQSCADLTDHLIK